MNAQIDLFSSDLDPFEIDLEFSAARRTALDPGSWVDVVPAWIKGSHALFERLLTRVPWQQHDRELFDQTFREPRLTAQYRDIRAPKDAALLQIANALSRRYGTDYDSLWLNLYRCGEDSTGWHRDRFASREKECIVPVLSLGATRKFLLKPRSGGRSLTFKPASGHLIVMGGRCQQDWVHSVPKDPGLTEARISLNFQSTAQMGARIIEAEFEQDNMVSFDSRLQHLQPGRSAREP
jgi:alkylated DNA repair dioxygenase AlkB